MPKNIDFNSSIKIGEHLAEPLINSLAENDLFIFSPTSRSLIDKNLQIKAASLDSTGVGINKGALNSFIKNEEFKRIVSLGNGRTTDAAKYIAYSTNSELISIPTALTTNVFFTNKSCLLEDGLKKTFQSKTPDTLLIDLEILDKVPFKYNLFGLCDVLSIHTALHDWDFSLTSDKPEKIDTFLYEMASFTLQQLISNRKNITKSNPESLEIITRLLMLAGYITNIAGCGRPESGSEHIIASFLEKNIDTYHAVSVIAGILIVMRLQNSEDPAILSAIKDLGLLDALADDEETLALLHEIPNNVKPRKDRYTILNEKQVTNKDIEAVISYVLKNKSK